MNVNSHPDMVTHQLVLLHIQKVISIIQTYGSASHSAPHAACPHPEFFTEGGGADHEALCNLCLILKIML